MALVRGDPAEHPRGRIRNTRKLLTTAALIMSGLLITSSFAATVLISHQAFGEGGQASRRALAYLAHGYLGGGLGSVSDLSTIGIWWFAGASAMPGCSTSCPGTCPAMGWRPSGPGRCGPGAGVHGLAVGITVRFRADVEAQAGAYATGVLVLMRSAALAVTRSVRRRGPRSSRPGCR
jgi:hypothetical protein